MKRLIFLYVACLCCAALAADEKMAYPTMPEVVMLSDGRVLKKPLVKKCGPELVTLGGAGWTQSVRYEALPDDVRSILEPFRPGGARWFAGDTSGNTAVIDGQIFVQTLGASSYKFGNVIVYIFDLNLLSRFSGDTKHVQLPRPLHQTVTDADGKFTLRVPKNKPYFVFAQAGRGIPFGSTIAMERFEWRVPMSAVRKGQILRLSNDNRSLISDVTIEEMP